MKRIRLILTVCALAALFMCFLTSCTATTAAVTDRAFGPATQKANQKAKHRLAHNYYQTHQTITQK